MGGVCWCDSGVRFSNKNCYRILLQTNQTLPRLFVQIFHIHLYAFFSQIISSYRLLFLAEGKLFLGQVMATFLVDILFKLTTLLLKLLCVVRREKSMRI